MNGASFVLCGCPIVAKTAIPTSRAAKMAYIAIRWDLVALSRDQKKLFPHFSEASTAVFAVEEVESWSINTLLRDRPCRSRRLIQMSPTPRRPIAF